DIGQAGANGATVKSSPITGYIDLFDQYNDPFPFAPGVTVSVLKGDSLLTATTDTNGKFSLPALPPGNYDVHVPKPGFDSLKVFVQNAGGDEGQFIGGTKMIQHASTKVTGFTNYILSSYLFLTTTISDPAANGSVDRAFNYYYSHSSYPTSQNYDY